MARPAPGHARQNQGREESSGQGAIARGALRQVLDDASPLAGKTPDELEQSQAEILVLLSGIDETFEQTVHARSSYRADEIIWNARFRSIYLSTRVRPGISVDVSRLHETEGA